MMVAGMDDPNDLFKPINKALQGEKRIRYFSGYLQNLAAAIKYAITFPSNLNLLCLLVSRIQVVCKNRPSLLY